MQTQGHPGSGVQAFGLTEAFVQWAGRHYTSQDVSL